MLAPWQDADVLRAVFRSLSGLPSGAASLKSASGTCRAWRAVATEVALGDTAISRRRGDSAHTSGHGRRAQEVHPSSVQASLHTTTSLCLLEADSLAPGGEVMSRGPRDARAPGPVFRTGTACPRQGPLAALRYAFLHSVLLPLAHPVGFPLLHKGTLQRLPARPPALGHEGAGESIPPPALRASRPCTEAGPQLAQQVKGRKRRRVGPREEPGAARWTAPVQG
ncbi:hypothetical protein ACKKBF_B31555 [Auxenochlorella protothecoides x Auxenochlorella symbiontica]